MRELMRLALAATVICTGCLADPDPAENAGTSNSDANNASNNGQSNNANSANSQTDNNASNNGTSNMGDDECAECDEDATACGTDDQGRQIYQKCEMLEGSNPAFNHWTTTEVCEGDQTCTVNVGCGCPNACTQNGRVECGPMGVTACVVVNGCARKVNIGRQMDCALPDPPAAPLACTQDGPSYPWCTECESGSTNGRECKETCPGVTKGFTCGFDPP